MPAPAPSTDATLANAVADSVNVASDGEAEVNLLDLKVLVPNRASTGRTRVDDSMVCKKSNSYSKVYGGVECLRMPLTAALLMEVCQALSPWGGPLDSLTPPPTCWQAWRS